MYRVLQYPLICLIFIEILINVPVCGAQVCDPVSSDGEPLQMSGDVCSRENTGSWLAGFYGQYISSIDGSQCPCLPTCSSYSAGAFKKHGFFVGWIMTVDRLLHEADESSVSRVVVHQGRQVILDPVENNDFWWFHEDTQKLD